MERRREKGANLPVEEPVLQKNHGLGGGALAALGPAVRDAEHSQDVAVASGGVVGLDLIPSRLHDLDLLPQQHNN